MIRRHRLAIECLERRSLFAVGLIPLNFTVPLNQDTQPSSLMIDGDAIIKLNAMVLDPRATQPSDASLSGYEFVGSGNFSGLIEGLAVSGDFETDLVEIDASVDIPIEVDHDSRTIRLLFVRDGTFVAESAMGPQPGTMTIVVTAILDFNSRAIRGTTVMTFRTNDHIENSESPFQLDGALASDLQFPDASKPSLSGRVFDDANNDGQYQESESGVAGVVANRVSNVGGAITVLESVVTDANGYYAFYNLESEATEIRFRELPDAFDFGKKISTDTPLVDSVADSLDGTTSALLFDTEMHRLGINAGLRTTPFEFQSPNVVTDVNNDGITTAADALEIINFLGRLPSGASDVELAVNREPGELFYDVDANGRLSAADALAVIRSLQSSPSLLSAAGESPLETDWVDNDLDRRKRWANDVRDASPQSV